MDLKLRLNSYIVCSITANIIGKNCESQKSKGSSHSSASTHPKLKCTLALFFFHKKVKAEFQDPNLHLPNQNPSAMLVYQKIDQAMICPERICPPKYPGDHKTSEP